MTIRVCHISSAHARYDTRIFRKECTSLAKAGYDVTFLVADNKQTEIKNDVKIVSVSNIFASRLKRILTSQKIMFKKAIEIDADIYHLHDPELLLLALKLKKKGKKVIFDSHEDYISTIKEKEYIPRILRGIISYFYKTYEVYVCKNIDFVICCYHWTKERLEKHNVKTDLIFNFPIIKNNISNLFEKNDIKYVVYAGNISSQWNHETVIAAINKSINIRYLLAGRCDDQYLEKLMAIDGWDNIDFYGQLPYETIIDELYPKSFCGVALLGYITQTKGRIGNLSNTKLFEYMMMGVPVICTDFELWKEIIDKWNCGICVNPYDIFSVSDAIKYLAENPDKTKEMGENGRRAVLEEFNWGIEEKKLINLYISLF